MNWRREAKRALYDYPRIQKRKASPQITPNYSGTVVQHSATRTTENTALASGLSEREEAVIEAVELALEMQTHYHNAEARFLMVRLVYFQRTHTLEGAAVECNYSLDAVKRWNTEILTAVYVALQKCTLQDPKTVV